MLFVNFLLSAASWHHFFSTPGTARLAHWWLPQQFSARRQWSLWKNCQLWCFGGCAFECLGRTTCHGVWQEDLSWLFVALNWSHLGSWWYLEAPTKMGCKWSSYIPNHRVVRVEEIWNAKEQRQKTRCVNRVDLLEGIWDRQMRSQVFVQFCSKSSWLETQLIWRRKLSLWIWKLWVIRGKMTHPNSPEEPPNFHVALNVCDSDFPRASHVQKVWIQMGIWTDRYSYGLDVFGYRRRSHSNDSLDLSKRHRPIWSERYNI